MVADQRMDSKLLSYATVFFLIILMPTYVVHLIHNDTIYLPIQDNTQDVLEILGATVDCC